MKIYPSILQPTANSLFCQIEHLKRKYDYFQIDIADGKFVDNKTVSIQEIHSYLKKNNVNKSASQKTVFSCEFHLMVVDYQNAFEKLTHLAEYWRIEKVIIHLKALEHTTTSYDIRNPISETSLGIAVNPEEDISKNYHTIATFPYTLIMSVHPGKQGSSFLPITLNKIIQLRKLGYNGQIGLDGGINEKTLPLVQKLPVLPDFVFAGSWIAVK